MDRPIPEEAKIHTVGPFSLMGCMQSIPYEYSDKVNYGGMIFEPVDVVRQPDDPNLPAKWILRCGNWQAEVWMNRNGSMPLFYCS